MSSKSEILKALSNCTGEATCDYHRQVLIIIATILDEQSEIIKSLNEKLELIEDYILETKTLNKRQAEINQRTMKIYLIIIGAIITNLIIYIIK